MSLRDVDTYLKRHLVIRTKKGTLSHLIPKPAQQLVLDAIREERAAGRPPRLLILKARQEGISTLTEGVMFHDTVTRRLVQTLIVAHREDSTRKLFRMNQLFFDYLPRKLQPLRKHSNAQELVFENPTRDPKKKRLHPGLMSSIRCVTAGEGMGRSETLTNVHLSELAFWRGDINSILDGVMQSIPDDVNTLAVIESTANGYNAFRDLWEGASRGENSWRPLFIAWFLEPDYRRSVEEGTEWTPEEQELMETYHLEPEQLAWRRWCIKANFRGDVEMFRQEYPSTPDEAFRFSGTPFFDNAVLVRLRTLAPEPVQTGAFTFPEPPPGDAPRNWTFTEGGENFLRIYQPPEKGVPYVIGGDTAGEGSDQFTAFVVDNRTGAQVAELAFPFSELHYARELYCLGKWYNDALIAVEINYSTYPERKLEEWGYPNLYVRERMDSYTRKPMKSFGFATTSKTRPVILAGLHAVMDETPELVRSAQTLGEMIRFVYNEDHRPEAEAGAHDDLVMAAAICYFARSQQTTAAQSTAAVRREWTADQYEDYERASPELRRQLEKQWGLPG